MVNIVTSERRLSNGSYFISLYKKKIKKKKNKNIGHFMDN